VGVCGTAGARHYGRMSDASLTCPHGHEGPWHLVEVTETWWECAIVGSVVILGSESLDEVEVEGFPLMLSCQAESKWGNYCLAQVPVPDHWTVVRD